MNWAAAPPELTTLVLTGRLSWLLICPVGLESNLSDGTHLYFALLGEALPLSRGSRCLARLQSPTGEVLLALERASLHGALLRGSWAKVARALPEPPACRASRDCAAPFPRPAGRRAAARPTS